jgi:hypothetical protein
MTDTSRYRFGDVDLIFGPHYRTTWTPTDLEINKMKEKSLLGTAIVLVIDQDGILTVTPILGVEAAIQ